MVRFSSYVKNIIRLFEGKSHVKFYAQHRPTWPPEVSMKAIQYLQSTKAKFSIENGETPCKHLVDVGCGSGQSTPHFAPYCEKITAIDPSLEQISMVLRGNEFDNIDYKVGEAENLPLPDDSVELICCAQSVHWVDWDEYFKECRRVLVPHGCMATYGYEMPKILVPGYEMATEECNTLFMNFYKRCQFHPRRAHVDNRLEEFFKVLPCKEKQRDDSLEIVREWHLSDLQGYISSWSGYQKAEDSDPLPQLINDLEQAIGPDEVSKVKLIIKWSIFMILSGRPF